MDLNLKIAERLASSGETVKNLVIDLLVQKEVDLRVNQISAALVNLTKLETQLSRTDRPDIKTYNKDGSVASELYSDARIKEINSAKKKIDSIRNAINTALEKGDYEPLNKLNGSDKSGSQEQSEKASS